MSLDLSFCLLIDRTLNMPFRRRWPSPLHRSSTTRKHLMLQQNMSTTASSVHLPPHPDTPKLLWNCCERAHGPSVAFPANVQWHSPTSSSDVQQRDAPHGPKSVTAVASPIHVGLKIQVKTFVWANCPRPKASITIARESNFQKCRVFSRFEHYKQKRSGQHKHRSPIMETFSTAQDLENIGVGTTCGTVNIFWCWCHVERCRCVWSVSTYFFGQSPLRRRS